MCDSLYVIIDDLFLGAYKLMPKHNVSAGAHNPARPFFLLALSLALALSLSLSASNRVRFDWKIKSVQIIKPKWKPSPKASNTLQSNRTKKNSDISHFLSLSLSIRVRDQLLILSHSLEFCFLFFHSHSFPMERGSRGQLNGHYGIVHRD